MKIKRLRLTGFKSFVEPTELVIEPGLTGVVGPNGCGKSNLLEALRWVMGETSHKSMRAAAMDDVIFAGTNHRPARNSAEVTIFIDNAERKAPAQFNDSDVIEIARRIEREAGSAYRINGREARARDIKILFEDAATGARSPALVRQGQIGELVNAKPENRRRILEDAAGVAGLHSRRHEAELRMKGAEANLARLNDVLGALGAQVESLKRQARAARRYKEISAEIRRSEALHAHLTWTLVQSLVEAEEAKLRETLTTLGAAVELEAQVVAQEAMLAASIQPLRDEEATRGVILARLKHEQENFEREATRAAEREKELRGRVEQLRRDIAREEDMSREAAETLTRLDAEIAAIEDYAHDIQAEDEVREKLAAVEKRASEAERKVADLANRAAETRARRRSIETGLGERREAVARIERQLASLDAQRREIVARAPDAAKLETTTETGRQLALELAEIEAEALEADEDVVEQAAVAQAAREAAANARLAARALAAERETLAKLLVAARDPGHPPVVDSLEVAPGYETALGASLGDDLDASVLPDAAVHWRVITPARADPALPSAAEPLSRYVEAPPELARRLRQIGVVAADAGPELQRHLKPGQRLVSKAGDLWRWDGFVAAGFGATAAAQRLAQKNRLADVEADETTARQEADRLGTRESAAVKAHMQAEMRERVLRQSWRETQARLSELREQSTVIERVARETEARVASVTEARERAQDELIEAHERLSEMETTLDLLVEDDDVETRLAAAQTETASARAAVVDVRTALATLEREARMRSERAGGARAERDRWATRTTGADKQIASLRARLGEAESELMAYDDLPALIDEKRQKLLNELSDAERRRRAAADKLAAADGGLRAASQALRSAQATVAEARESRARIEARLEASRTRRQEEARRIRETLDAAPEGCLKLAEVADGAELPAVAELERKLHRLKGDRERLGGVNLQADDELQKLDAQFQSIDKEKADIEEAIAKLRGAIGLLNREAKARLKQAFDSVNGHFQRLFTTLFSGGEARLDLIESEEDPLQGGLEIIAKPPGKKPATLSLLSGGEQTLTALSLIFAVFLTNPSPICVLDEVDAPLDDSNVDRFATLMEKMASETDTRFLVITHHPMTMVRMNRLFGVTMGEKGVSQLVSVDLETAQGFVGEGEESAA